MFTAPKQTPSLSVLLDDLGRPAPRAVARLLDVHERTVYGWQAKDEAPRAALLALFWESSWGRQWVHAMAVNDARMAAVSVSVLEAENLRLKGRIAYLERVADYGSANAPTFTPSPMWPDGPRLATSNGVTTG